MRKPARMPALRCPCPSVPLPLCSPARSFGTKPSSEPNFKLAFLGFAGTMRPCFMHPETPESAWFYEAWTWVEVHKKQVIVGAGVVVGAVVLFYVYDWHRDQAESSASEALLQLRAMPTRQEGQPIAPATDFLKVARQYSSTLAGERALLLGAAGLFGEGKYAEAQAQFESFPSSYEDSSLAPIAALGVAASLDAQDKLDAALASYQSVVAKYPNDYAASRAKLAMASIHESKNQPDRALRLYDELIRPAAFSGVAGEASMYKERLLRRHPELAATNVAAGVAKPAPVAVATNKPSPALAPTATNKPPLSPTPTKKTASTPPPAPASQSVTPKPPTNAPPAKAAPPPPPAPRP